MFVDLVSSEDVLRAVRTRGPMIPMEIRKFLGRGDSITIGAELSTLVKKGFVRATSVKMGGSPFYYVRGQENKLELLNKYLNDKDKRAFEHLREEKVMKDSSQEPLMRVSLRSIPDFAKKVELTRDSETVLFWRWYMVSEDDAIAIIRGDLKRRDVSEQSPASQMQSFASQSVSLAQSSSVQSKPAESLPRDDFIEEKEVAKKEVSEGVASLSVPDKPQVKPAPVVQSQKPKVSVEEQKTIEDDVPSFDDVFFSDLKKFFSSNNIKLKKAEMVRKGSDYEFVVEMNTPFGATEYFCKAKSKKKCNEGDLSSAYLQGQNKRMPTVFITTGEITKKAKQKAKDEYKGLLVKEL